MRLILVRGGGDEVLGDTTRFVAASREWTGGLREGASPDEMAVLAARLFDEAQGWLGRSYEFAHFCRDRAGGYDVFQAVDAQGFSEEDARNLCKILLRCRYVGHVRRRAHDGLLRPTDWRARACVGPPFMAEPFTAREPCGLQRQCS